MDERRQYVRVSAALDVRFRRLDPPDNAAVEAVTSNIGGGGVFIPTPEVFPRGTLIELSLAIPGRKDRVESIGRVAWVQESVAEKGMGVEFYRIKKADREQIISVARRGTWFRIEETRRLSGPESR